MNKGINKLFVLFIIIIVSISIILLGTSCRKDNNKPQSSSEISSNTSSNVSTLNENEEMILNAAKVAFLNSFNGPTELDTKSILEFCVLMGLKENKEILKVNDGYFIPYKLLEEFALKYLNIKNIKANEYQFDRFADKSREGFFLPNQNAFSSLLNEVKPFLMKREGKVLTVSYKALKGTVFTYQLTERSDGSTYLKSLKENFERPGDFVLTNTICDVLLNRNDLLYYDVLDINHPDNIIGIIGDKLNNIRIGLISKTDLSTVKYIKLKGNETGLSPDVFYNDEYMIIRTDESISYIDDKLNVLWDLARENSSPLINNKKLKLMAADPKNCLYAYCDGTEIFVYNSKTGKIDKVLNYNKDDFTIGELIPLYFFEDGKKLAFSHGEISSTFAEYYVLDLGTKVFKKEDSNTLYRWHKNEDLKDPDFVKSLKLFTSEFPSNILSYVKLSDNRYLFNLVNPEDEQKIKPNGKTMYFAVTKLDENSSSSKD